MRPRNRTKAASLLQTMWHGVLLYLALFSNGHVSDLATAQDPNGISAPGYTVDYAIPPSPFHGIHGSDFDADGHLLVGDIAGFTVHRVNVETGKTTVVAGPYDGLADDVKVAPDNGQIVWTTTADGRVMSILPGGEKVALATGLPGMNAIAFHPDGRLFASQLGGADAVWEIDRTGAAPPGKVLEDIGGLNAFAFDDDGRAYGPVGTVDTGTKIVRLDFETGEVETVANGFTWIAAVKMGPTGLLYASDLLSGEIWEVSKETGDRRLVADLGYFIDNITVRDDGLIFAAETSTNSIISVDPSNGETKHIIKGTIPVAEDVALGMNADGKGQLMYIGGLYAGKVLDLTTGQVTTFSDTGPDTLEFPSHVRVQDDLLLWSAWFGGLVKVVNRFTGEVVRHVEGLAVPRDVLLTPDGGLLVIEQQANRLSLFSPDSGSRVVVADTLSAPMGMIWDGLDHVLVTETDGGRLTRVSIAGGSTTIMADGFQSPEGLVRLNDKTVAVVDAQTGEVIKVDLETGAKHTIITGLTIGLSPPPPLPRHWLKSGIAVDSDGTLYVPSDIETAVYRFTPIDR